MLLPLTSAIVHPRKEIRASEIGGADGLPPGFLSGSTQKIPIKLHLPYRCAIFLPLFYAFVLSLNYSLVFVCGELFSTRSEENQTPYVLAKPYSISSYGSPASNLIF